MVNYSRLPWVCSAVFLELTSSGLLHEWCFAQICLVDFASSIGKITILAHT